MTEVHQVPAQWQMSLRPFPTRQILSQLGKLIIPFCATLTVSKNFFCFLSQSFSFKYLATPPCITLFLFFIIHYIMQFQSVILALAAVSVVSAANASNKSNGTNGSSSSAGAAVSNVNIMGAAAAAAAGVALLF